MDLGYVIAFGCGASCGIVAAVIGIWCALWYVMSRPGSAWS